MGNKNINLNLEECNFSMYTQVLYNKDKYITKAMKFFLDMINNEKENDETYYRC